MKKYVLLIICLISLLNKQAFAQPANDECATAQNLGTLPAPAACPSGVGIAATAAGTLVAATSSNPYVYQNGCSGAGGPNMGVPASDVWYSFVASGYEAVITINSTFANPNVAMYAGSCASLGGGVGGCAVGTGGTVTLTVEQMVIGTTYYLQVSGNVGQTGTFNISVKNNKSCTDCINSTTLSVSPLPVNGMYNPGQTVHFCYHISTYAEINTNWLHGVQVGLGSGWNVASVVASPVTSYDCGTWTYYPGGITDPSGQPWPAGFYFNRTCNPLGGGTAADGIPGNNFGDHITANTTNDQLVHTIPAGTWNFCFDVTVANGCSPGSNLSVTINTSGDGESGPWTSAGCSTDPATPFNAVGSCCPPTMTSVAATCAGNDGTATATPVGVSGPYDYSWTNSSGTVVSTSTGVAGANTATGLTPGVYTVSLTNVLNCLSTNTVTVGGVAGGAPPVPGSNSPVCEGGTLNLTSSTVAGAAYSWTGPNSFASAVQNPSITSVTTAASGVYTVTANVGGCISSATTTVTINPVPTVTVPANSTVCNGASVPAAVFTSTPTGATYAWTNSNPAIGLAANGINNIASFTATNATANPITATISVTPTLAGCPGTPATYTITVNPTPVVVVPANSTVCNGSTVAAANFTSTTTGTTFAWTNSNSAIGLGASGIGNIAAFSGTNTSTAPITATITVTPTANGCPGTPSSYTITVNPTPDVTVPANITVCNGASIAASNYTSTTTGTTFAWTNSNPAIGLGGSGIGNTPTFTGTNTGAAGISGTITVTPTANTCPGTPATYTITVNPIPTVTVPANITVCNGSNIAATSFTSPVTGATFSWTNSNPAIGIAASGNGDIAAFTGTNTGAAPITATITVTPAAGCPGTPSSYTITVNPTPDVTVPANITVCDGTSIPASNFTSTTTGTTFAWANSNNTIGLGANGIGNTPTFTGTNSGAVGISGTVTVTPTANTCPGTPTTYTITVNPIPTVTVPANITVCNGASIAATSFTSPVTGATFTWTNSDPTIGIAASGIGNIATFNATNAGTAAITATITVTPAAGCPGTPNSYTITVNPTPNVTVPANIAVCNGSSIAATNFTSNVTGATFGWTNSNASIGLGTSGIGDIPTFNGTNSGTTPLVATITVTPAANTCSGTPATYTITVNPDVIASAGPDDTICFNGSTVLNATPNGAGYTYSWAAATGLNNTNTYNPTANPATTTNYTVTITDANGCVGSDNVTIYSDPQITIAKTAIDVTCNGACNGQTIVIPNGGSGVFTYSWTSGCTTASCTGLCPGSYTVTVTDSWGCTAAADTTVSEPTAVNALITGQTATSCNAVCDGTATASANGGTPGAGYAYSWNSVPAQPVSAATALCAGAYIVTVSDSHGCQDTAHVTIIQPTPVVIPPIPAVTICIGSSTTITAVPSGGNSTYHYNWLPAGTGGDVASVTVSPVVTTSYTVNVTDANGCTAPPVIATVNVNPPLTVVAAGATSICPGTTTPISAVAAGGNGGPYTYTWGPIGTPAGSPVTVAPNATTTYTVIATDNCGTPPAIDSVTVTLLPVPVVAFAADVTSGCVPLCVNFTDSSTIASGTITNWAWDFGGDGTASAQNPATHCFNIAGLYSISLTVSSAAGCSATYTNVNTIDAYALPDAEFTTTPNPASVLNSTVNFTDQSSSDAVYWYWSFGDGDTLAPLTQNPVHTYPNAVASSYNATLTIHNNHQCYATVTHTIDIGPEFTFYIPNAFTPNNDGINDYFNGAGIGIDKYEMYIFDRWGNLIFDTDSLSKPWDGKANHGSEMAQQDVYVWKVKLTDVFGKKHNYIGTVTIVK
ncbi:MAG: Ig domain protein group 2 domain protein [Bacteroidetes bacterium]|nr:Ig domain protein group 2 domain protein [Bacteroidota bacterium]